MPLKRGQIVQMADDRRIVVRARRARARIRARRARSAYRRPSRPDRRRECATSGGCCCAAAISERIGRATGASVGALKRHLDANMRAQPLPCPEFARDKPDPPRRNGFHRRFERLADKLETGPGQRLEDRARDKRVRSRRARLALLPAARHLEIDILGKALDQAPSPSTARCRRRRPASCRPCRRRDHAERADDMPVLFDQAR